MSYLAALGVVRSLQTGSHGCAAGGPLCLPVCLSLLGRRDEAQQTNKRGGRQSVSPSKTGGIGLYLSRLDCITLVASLLLCRTSCHGWPGWRICREMMAEKKIDVCAQWHLESVECLTVLSPYLGRVCASQL